MSDNGMITIKIPPEKYVGLLETLERIDGNAGDIFHITMLEHMDTEGWVAYHDFYYTRAKKSLGLDGTDK